MIQQLEVHQQSQVLDLIETIIYEGGNNNFVILGLSSDYYIQIAAAKGAYEVYCEAVSNYYLEEENWLQGKQIEWLEKLNWNLKEDENYSLSHSVDSENSRELLAKLIVDTAMQAYKVDGIDFNNISLNLE